MATSTIPVKRQDSSLKHHSYAVMNSRTVRRLSTPLHSPGLKPLSHGNSTDTLTPKYSAADFMKTDTTYWGTRERGFNLRLHLRINIWEGHFFLTYI